MRSNNAAQILRDLLDVLDENDVYVLERSPDDVVVDGAFDPEEIAEALARKWEASRKNT